MISFAEVDSNTDIYLSTCGSTRFFDEVMAQTGGTGVIHFEMDSLPQTTWVTFKRLAIQVGGDMNGNNNTDDSDVSRSRETKPGDAAKLPTGRSTIPTGRCLSQAARCGSLTLLEWKENPVADTTQLLKDLVCGLVAHQYNCEIAYLPSMNWEDGPADGGSPDPFAAPAWDGADYTWVPSYEEISG